MNHDPIIMNGEAFTENYQPDRLIGREDEVRLTPFGKFLRASSLDELPQLINVWQGAMSLVGPRPLMA